MHVATIWAQETGKGQALNRKDISTLETLPLEDNQFRWILRHYLKGTVWPSVYSFVSYVRGYSDIPEDIVCAAFLSRSPRMIMLAEELETLSGAWEPTVETRQRIDVIRQQLRENLS